MKMEAKNDPDLWIIKDEDENEMKNEDEEIYIPKNMKWTLNLNKRRTIP